MTQQSTCDKLEKLKALTADTAVSALVLSNEPPTQGLQSVYRNLRDLIKNKRVDRTDGKYHLKNDTINEILPNKST